MKFVKKPVVIEATQWFKMGDHLEVRMPVDESNANWLEDLQGLPKGSLGIVDTLEGAHYVTPGDWIITGVKGEHYPCKPDIFEMTYEPFPEDEVFMAALGPCGK
jgi:hypothetical protein